MLWQLIYALFGVEWLMFSLVKNVLLSWHGFFFSFFFCFIFFWGGGGGTHSKFAWIHCREEEKESIKSNSFMFILNYMEEEKHERFQKHQKYKSSN